MQLVIAAITTEPWSSTSAASSSITARVGRRFGRALAPDTHCGRTFTRALRGLFAGQAGAGRQQTGQGITERAAGLGEPNPVLGTAGAGNAGLHLGEIEAQACR